MNQTIIGCYDFIGIAVEISLTKVAGSGIVYYGILNIFNLLKNYGFLHILKLLELKNKVTVLKLFCAVKFLEWYDYTSLGGCVIPMWFMTSNWSYIEFSRHIPMYPQILLL